MERKLAQYRKKKAMEAYITDIKTKISGIGDHFIRRNSSTIEENTDENEQLIEPTDEENLLERETSSPSPEPPKEPEKSYSKISLAIIFCVWAIVYYVFIKLQFGMVYLLISCIVFICLNTRTGSKQEGEISAYSVFNKNCERIDGSINPEQFEKELGYRMK